MFLYSVYIALEELRLFFEYVCSAFNVEDLVLEYATVAIILFAYSVTVNLAFFALRGIGVYKISKRQGESKPWLAFVPYANLYLLGKITDRKKLGFWLMISSIVVDAVLIVIDLVYYLPEFIDIFSTGTYLYNDFSANLVYTILAEAQFLFSLCYVVLEAFTIFIFFKYYGGKSGTVFAILSIFFEFLFPIFVFVVRNNEKANYSVRFSFESRGGASYGNNQNYNGYQNAANSGSTEKPEEKKEHIDVFSDFPDKPDDTNDNDDGDLF